MRCASLADVQRIGGQMWDRGREELKYLGISPEDWLWQWRQRIQRGDAVVFCDHALLGCDWEAPGVVSTAFQASKAFEEGLGKQVTKEMRKAIPELMKARGISLICTYSLCVDPEAPKWFRLLGLEEDRDFQGPMRGPYKLRRFIRRA